MELGFQSGRRVLIDMERTGRPRSRTNTERLPGTQEIRPAMSCQVASTFSVSGSTKYLGESGELEQPPGPSIGLKTSHTESQQIRQIVSKGKHTVINLASGAVYSCVCLAVSLPTPEFSFL